MTIFDQSKIAAELIQSSYPLHPRIALITGTGLKGLIKELKMTKIINYSELPGMPISTASSHEPKLYLGTINSVPILVFGGRLHYYEGHSMQQVIYPIRILHHLDINTLIITNVAGGLQVQFQPGDIVFIKDHINLSFRNPLIGQNDERFGPRFPDMSNTYDLNLRKVAQDCSRQLDIPYVEGIYAGLAGPSLETKSEYKMLHRCGADLVGLSTVPEVIAARHQGISTVACSLISNSCYPIERITKTTIEEVIEVATLHSAKLNALLISMIKTIHGTRIY